MKQFWLHMFYGERQKKEKKKSFKCAISSRDQVENLTNLTYSKFAPVISYSQNDYKLRG